MVSMFNVVPGRTDFSGRVAAELGEALTPGRPEFLAGEGVTAAPDFVGRSGSVPNLSREGIAAIASTEAVTKLGAAMAAGSQTAKVLLGDLVVFSDQEGISAQALKQLLVADEPFAIEKCKERVNDDRVRPASGITSTLDLVKGFSGLPFSPARAQTLLEVFVVDEIRADRAGGSAVILGALDTFRTYGPVATPYAISLLKTVDTPDVFATTAFALSTWSAAPDVLRYAAIDGSARADSDPRTFYWSEMRRGMDDAELGRSPRKGLRTAILACRRLEGELGYTPGDEKPGLADMAKDVAKRILRNLPKSLSAYLLKGVRNRFPLAYHDLEAGAEYAAAKRSDTPVASNRGRFVAAHTAASTVVELLRWDPGFLVNFSVAFKDTPTQPDLLTKEGRTEATKRLRDHFIGLPTLDPVMALLDAHFGAKGVLESALHVKVRLTPLPERVDNPRELSRRVEAVLAAGSVARTWPHS